MGVIEQVGEIIDRQPNNGGQFSVGFDDDGATIVRFGGPIAALGLQRLAEYQQTLQEAGFHVEQLNFPQRQGLPKRTAAGTRSLNEHRVGLAKRAHLRVTAG